MLLYNKVVNERTQQHCVESILGYPDAISLKVGASMAI
jgi:hypothetical protein